MDRKASMHAAWTFEFIEDFVARWVDVTASSLIVLSPRRTNPAATPGRREADEPQH
jgi:hypothetical protein